MKEPKLLPCPFCGGKAQFEKDWDRIQCWGCAFYYNYEGDDKKGAAEKWNRRPDHSAELKKLLEELLKIPAGDMTVLEHHDNLTKMEAVFFKIRLLFKRNESGE